MIRLTIAAAVALMIFSSCANKNKGVYEVPAETEGIGVVVDVHWPSQFGNHKYYAGNGDIVSGRFGWYRPPGSAANNYLNHDFNVLRIKKPISHTAAYIIFESRSIDPEELKVILGRLEGEIEDADYDDQAIKPGDTVYITAEDHYGATRVRLDIRRGENNKPVSNISFVNHYRKFRIDPLDPAAPYIPYVSEIE